MALITCPECGHSISTKAQTCPGCGLPLSSLPHNVIRQCHTGECVLEVSHVTYEQGMAWIQQTTQEPTYPYSYKGRSGSTYTVVLENDPIECVTHLKNVVRQQRGKNILEANRLTPREAAEYRETLEKESAELNAKMRRAGLDYLAVASKHVIVDADAPLKYEGDTPTRTADTRPKCPHCGSTNISKISTTSRMISTGLFGLASSKIGKTMECKKCGYKW